MLSVVYIMQQQQQVHLFLSAGTTAKQVGTNKWDICVE